MAAQALGRCRNAGQAIGVTVLAPSVFLIIIRQSLSHSVLAIRASREALVIDHVLVFVIAEVAGQALGSVRAVASTTLGMAVVAGGCRSVVAEVADSEKYANVVALITGSLTVDVHVFQTVHASISARFQDSEVWGSFIATLHTLIRMHFSAVCGCARHAIYRFSSAVASRT